VLNEQRKRLNEGNEKYRSLLHNISKILHPFTLTGDRRNTPEVVGELNKQVKEFSALGEEYRISDKQERLGKFSRQIVDLSSCIDAWWLWVEESIKSLEPYLDPRREKSEKEKYDWILASLLPKVYWEQQAIRADTVELRNAYRAVAQNALADLKSHPLTTTLLETQIKRFHSWAEWMVTVQTPWCNPGSQAAGGSTGIGCPWRPWVITSAR
jgi:hypothetical protein